MSKLLHIPAYITAKLRHLPCQSWGKSLHLNRKGHMTPNHPQKPWTMVHLASETRIFIGWGQSFQQILSSDAVGDCCRESCWYLSPFFIDSPLKRCYIHISSYHIHILAYVLYVVYIYMIYVYSFHHPVEKYIINSFGVTCGERMVGWCPSSPQDGCTYG